MFYCTLRDPLVMYLHKDERGFHKNQVRVTDRLKMKGVISIPCFFL